MSHTPGPWELVSKAGWPCVWGGGRIICSPGGFSIREMRNDSSKAGQITADAYLIAAAPEMLEALREAVQSMDVAQHSTFACLDKCRAAIAKATEGAQ